jgi:hypothetical protein
MQNIKQNTDRATRADRDWNHRAFYTTQRWSTQCDSHRVQQSGSTCQDHVSPSGMHTRSNPSALLISDRLPPWSVSSSFSAPLRILVVQLSELCIRVGSCVLATLTRKGPALWVSGGWRKLNKISHPGRVVIFKVVLVNSPIK